MKLNKHLSVIYFSVLGTSLANWLVVPYWALILNTNLKIPIQYVGIILGIANFSQFAFSIFSDKLVNRIGKFYAIILSLSISLTGFLLVSRINQSFTILGVILTGIGTAIYLPIVKGVLVTLSSEAQLKHNLSIFSSLLNIGMFLGPSIGSVLVYFHLSTLMLTLNNILFVLLLLANIIYLKDVKLLGTLQKQLKPKITLSKDIKYILFIQILFFILFVAFQNFTSIYFSKIDPLLFIFATSINTLFGIIQIIFVRMINRISFNKIAYLSFLFLGAGFYLFGVKLSSLYSYSLLIIIATVFISLAEIFLTLKIDFVIARKYKDNVTHLFGILRLSLGCGFLIGNIFAGDLYRHFTATQHWFWQSIGGISAIIGVILYGYFVVKPRFRRRIVI